MWRRPRSRANGSSKFGGRPIGCKQDRSRSSNADGRIWHRDASVNARRNDRIRRTGTVGISTAWPAPIAAVSSSQIIFDSTLERSQKGVVHCSRCVKESADHYRAAGYGNGIFENLTPTFFPATIPREHGCDPSFNGCGERRLRVAEASVRQQHFWL